MTSTEWQPIETATKDGRKILIWDGHDYRLGWWGYLDADQQSADGKAQKLYGWREMGSQIANPVKWQLLPEPPK